MPSSTSQGRPYPPRGRVNDPGVSRPDHTATWRPPTWGELTHQWSPRPYLRVDLDRAHTYATVHRLAAGQPDPGIPYALHLTDERGAYRLLAFDFDAHHGPSTAVDDASALSAELTRLEIPHLVCQSGPASGMHVWIRLDGPTPATQVTRLAAQARAAYPSLDTGALTNPATGCVRPPGAPHRSGGHSLPLGECHLEPVAFTDLTAIMPHLRQHAATTPVSTRSPSARPVTPVVTDPDGVPRLDGPRRPLSPAVRALAKKTVGPGQDASAIAYSVLLGMAHARMTRADAVDAAFTACWPALEHLRTAAAAGGARVPRPSREQHLARQWASAVAAASLAPRGTYRDTGSPGRRAAEALAARTLDALDSSPGRWQGKTGTQDHLILCALAHRLVVAATDTVHLSERAWALATGLTRDVVADRLPTLIRQGWVHRVRPAAGPWAARWTLGPGGGETGSGAVLTPSRWQRLEGLLRSAREDVWHAPTLGVLGWRVWTELRRGWLPVTELARRIGVQAVTVRRKLAGLQRLRLVGGDGRAHARPSRLAEAAAAAGVAGAHADRVRLYRLQSAVFVWWFTARYQPQRPDGGPADALAEWGDYPSPTDAAAVHPADIALTYGAVSTGPPPESTTWAAAMVAQEQHRHTDPDYWWQLVADARTALPGEDVLAPAHRHTAAAA